MNRNASHSVPSIDERRNTMQPTNCRPTSEDFSYLVDECTGERVIHLIQDSVHIMRTKTGVIKFTGNPPAISPVTKMIK
jgi:hypothetical protein